MEWRSWRSRGGSCYSWHGETDCSHGQSRGLPPRYSGSRSGKRWSTGDVTRRPQADYRKKTNRLGVSQRQDAFLVDGSIGTSSDRRRRDRVVLTLAITGYMESRSGLPAARSLYESYNRSSAPLAWGLWDGCKSRCVRPVQANSNRPVRGATATFLPRSFSAAERSVTTGSRRTVFEPANESETQISTTPRNARDGHRGLLPGRCGGVGYRRQMPRLRFGADSAGRSTFTTGRLPVIFCTSHGYRSGEAGAGVVVGRSSRGRLLPVEDSHSNGTALFSQARCCSLVTATLHQQYSGREHRL